MKKNKRNQKLTVVEHIQEMFYRTQSSQSLYG